MGSEAVESTSSEPSPRAIVAEAQRRLEDHGRHIPPPGRQPWAVRLNRAVFWLAKHWLVAFSALIALYLLGAILPAVLMRLGAARAASILYALYSPFCHQYPFRSWFLFGSRAAYPLQAPVEVLEMNALRTFVGDPHTGYKIALCQRDIALYGAMLLYGIIFGVLPRRERVRPLPGWLFFVFCVLPIALDGGVQWLSYAVWQFFPALLSAPFETIPLLRTLTGALFGAGITAVAYPYLRDYFAEVRAALREKYGWI